MKFNIEHFKEKRRKFIEECLSMETFPSKAMQKDALDYVNREYEDLQKSNKEAFRKAKDSSAISEKEYNRLYWLAPYGLHQIRPKHKDAFPENWEKVTELLQLREHLKNMEIVKPISKKEQAENEVSRWLKANPALAELLASQRETIESEARAKASQEAERIKKNFAGRTLDELIVIKRQEAFHLLTQSKPDATKRDIERAQSEAVSAFVSGVRVFFDNYDSTGFKPWNIKKYEDEEAEGAVFVFDSFVAKLSQLVGDNVVSASSNTNDVWEDSVLTVGYSDDSVRQFSTKRIVNYSVYGKGFYQWPTREISKVDMDEAKELLAKPTPGRSLSPK